MPQARQTLDNEWRRLTTSTLRFEKEYLDLEEFWSKLLTITDGIGTATFGTLSGFILTLLALPHSNAEVEFFLFLML